MQNTLSQSFHSIAAFFFFFIGMLYAIGYLLSSNGIFVIEFEYFLALADTPFVFTSLVYFFLSLFLRSQKHQDEINPDQKTKKDSFWPALIFIFLGSLLFFSYISVDFLV
jgi:hypothetical protein